MVYLGQGINSDAVKATKITRPGYERRRQKYECTFYAVPINKKRRKLQ